MPKEDYKPNSHKYTEQHRYDEPKTETRKVHTTEHRPLGDRFKEVFFGEAAHGSLEYVMWQIIVPQLADIATNALHAVIDSVFGRRGSSGYYGSSYNTSRTKYNSSYGYDREHKPARPTYSGRVAPTENHWFETREDAQYVLNQLNEKCRKYDGVCSVGTFYDLIDYERPDDWVASNLGWSWNALDKARIYRKPDGSYVLSIPEPDVRY